MDVLVIGPVTEASDRSDDTTPEPARAAGAAQWIRQSALVGAAATAAFLALFRPWGGAFRAPWSYGLDNFFQAMLVRNMQLGGGYGYADSLGAPYGQELYDFPQGGGRLHLGVWRLLGLVIDDPLVVINVYFALGFVLIAVVAFAVLRHLGLSDLLAGALGVVYAFLPYRFWHGVQHPQLSAYFAIPLAVLLAVWVATGQVPIRRAERAAWGRARLLRRAAAVALFAVLIGSSDPYYVVFTAILIGAAGGLEAIRRRQWAPAAAAALVAGTVGLVLVINLAPEIAFRRDNGVNERAATRLLAETEENGLHLTQMVAPSPEHRIDVLGAVGRRAADVPLPGEGGTAIGILGVAGLLVGAVAVLGLVPAVDERRLLVRRLGALQLAMILVATVGGGSLTLAVAGITQIRGWGRMAVVIAFLAFVVLGLTVDPVLARVRARGPRPRRLAAAAVVLVAVLGVLDGAPAGVRPDYDASRAERDADRAFVAEMEDALPAGSMVFQLPVVPFPESPPVGMGLYDHLTPYLLGDDRLRWSFGGVKGRVHDWQEVLAQEPIDRQLDGLAAAGFAAVYVDVLGYEDRGEEVIGRLDAVLGRAAGISSDSRTWWYDLRPYAAALRRRLGDSAIEALGGAVTTMVRAEPEGGFTGDEEVPDGSVLWMSSHATLALPNFGAEGREVIVRFVAVGPEGTSLRVVGGGVEHEVTFTDSPEAVELRLRLPEGATELSFDTDAPLGPGATGDERRVRIIGLGIADAVVESVLGPSEPAPGLTG